MWARSIAWRTLSPAWREGIKPTWSLWIKEPMLEFRQLERIFAKILISKLRTEMDLQLDHTVSSESGLGIIVILGVKVLVWNQWPSRIELSANSNIGARRSAIFLQYVADRPSGPGRLFSLRALIAVRTSVIVMGLSSISVLTTVERVGRLI